MQIESVLLASILFRLSRRERTESTALFIRRRCERADARPAKTESSDRKVHIDRNSKCSDNLSRPFVVRCDCTHAQSVRENGNRAKWIRSLRKSVWEEGRGGGGGGGDERGEQQRASVRWSARATETRNYRSAATGRAKLAPSRLANIFFRVREGRRTFEFISSVMYMHRDKTDRSFVPVSFNRARINISMNPPLVEITRAHIYREMLIQRVSSKAH